MCELKASAVSSITVQTDGNGINTLNMFKQNNMRVIDIGFKNQGTSSIAVIRFDGGEIRLDSGTRGEGAAWSPTIPFGYFDLTNYNVQFINNGAAATQVNKLFIGYRFVVDKP